jgi:hypothetical protein
LHRGFRGGIAKRQGDGLQSRYTLVRSQVPPPILFSLLFTLPVKCSSRKYCKPSTIAPQERKVCLKNLSRDASNAYIW